MKQDVAYAFGPDPDPDRHAGTALLARLGRAPKDGLVLDRITLVGHSTGAIYIAQWLSRSRDHLPADFKQDLVFLAQAIIYELFADTLATRAPTPGLPPIRAATDWLAQTWNAASADVIALQHWCRTHRAGGEAPNPHRPPSCPSRHGWPRSTSRWWKRRCKRCGRRWPSPKPLEPDAGFLTAC